MSGHEEHESESPGPTGLIFTGLGVAALVCLIVWGLAAFRIHVVDQQNQSVAPAVVRSLAQEQVRGYARATWHINECRAGDSCISPSYSEVMRVKVANYSHTRTRVIMVCGALVLDSTNGTSEPANYASQVCFPITLRPWTSVSFQRHIWRSLPWIGLVSVADAGGVQGVDGYATPHADPFCRLVQAPVPCY